MINSRWAPAAADQGAPGPVHHGPAGVEVPGGEAQHQPPVGSHQRVPIDVPVELVGVGMLPSLVLEEHPPLLVTEVPVRDDPAPAVLDGICAAGRAGRWSRASSGSGSPAGTSPAGTAAAPQRARTTPRARPARASGQPASSARCPSRRRRRRRRRAPGAADRRRGPGMSARRGHRRPPARRRPRSQAAAVDDQSPRWGSTRRGVSATCGRAGGSTGRPAGRRR